MKLIYKICEVLIGVVLIAVVVNHFFVLTDVIGIWAAIRIAGILLLNLVWYIIKAYKTEKTETVTFGKFIAFLVLPTAFSVVLFYGTGLPYSKIDRRLAYWVNSYTLSPLTYSGLGWQNNCPKVYRGVEGKRWLIDETTICFSITAPTCTSYDVCSFLARIKSKEGWEILGIGIKASHPEQIIFSPKEQIENPHLHQYRINKLPCNDKLLFVCSLRRISRSWLTPDIENALSVSFRQVECPSRKGGG